ncbi:MAG: tetratricopeptide repeat protein, partial [Candidatus Cybelea sp.]
MSRAKSAQKEFALTDGNAPLVADIVRRLDGIALAIELAAPRVRAFSVRELAKRLDDRLTLLTSGNRTELPRHQTLHALIEWSYELLNEAEQTLFRRLSIFCGNFTLDAAQAVCSDDCGDQEEVPSLISALVEKSLVAPEAGDGEQLYRLLESTRQYAFERLTLACESDSAASRHCRYFVTAAERASNETYEMPTDLWVARHRADLENYRAAIDWGLSQSNDACAGAAIVADLRRLWGNLLPSEGRALLARAMTVVSAAATPRLRGRLVLAAAYVGEGRSGRVEVRADELAQAVLVFAGANDHVRQIDALRMLAFSLGRSGEIAEALARFDEALVLARAFSHPWLVASTLIDLSSWLSESGNRERATNLLDEAMAIYKRQGDRPGIAMALFQMAEMRFAENDVYGALTNVREALAIGRTLSDDRFLGLFLHNKAAYLLAAGDVNEAALCAREALAVALRRGA